MMELANKMAGPGGGGMVTCGEGRLRDGIHVATPVSEKDVHVLLDGSVEG